MRAAFRRWSLMACSCASAATRMSLAAFLELPLLLPVVSCALLVLVSQSLWSEAACPLRVLLLSRASRGDTESNTARAARATGDTLAASAGVRVVDLQLDPRLRPPPRAGLADGLSAVLQ